MARNKSPQESLMQFMVAAAASAVICVIVTGDTLVIWPVGLALFILYYTFLKR